MSDSESLNQPDFNKYLGLVPSAGDPCSRLAAQKQEFLTFLGTISEKESLLIHPPYTWTIRQVVNHLSDCERVFSFRLLWMARGETEPMTSFDENRFSLLAQAIDVSLERLVEEFRLIRESTLALILTLPLEAWHRKGTAAGFSVDVLTQSNIIFGHTEHHLRILKQRMQYCL